MGGEGAHHWEMVVSGEPNYFLLTKTSSKSIILAGDINFFLLNMSSANPPANYMYDTTTVLLLTREPRLW